jgi:formylglycine-generating enzyme required for sulfatase activity
VPDPTVSAPYIFISYQRDSEADAWQVHEQLERAGFRVWQDIENIRHTARWPVAIDHALRETDRIVLLLTPKSMLSDEVFNEWFFYYSERKPIHCLMVETCKPHYQLVPFQWLDWRDPARRDWDRLCDELCAPFAWPALATREKVIHSPFAPARTLPEALQALLVAVRSETRAVALSDEQAEQIVQHHPADLTEYRLGRIAEWSQPRYQLDNRFVQLALLVDQGEDAQGPRWQEKRRFDDLRDVLTETPDCALVLLGAPGSGKSTLLRRLELDLAADRLRDDGDKLTFFIQLNQYRAPAPGAPLPPPGEWLAQRWHARYPDLPTLPDLLRQGRMLLLLDALNEMPHRDSREYRERIDLWKHFLLETLRDCPGNRVVFSCRSLDYSAPLSSPDLRVPQVQIEPMDDARIQQFLAAYLPAQADAIWRELDGSPQLDLFRTPYFLKLLLDQVAARQAIPKGRAGLFTGFVRQTLRREIERGNRLFEPDTLLTERDLERLTTNQWRDEHDLPEIGDLLPRISQLAFQMQANRIQTEGAQVRIDYDQARRLLAHERSADILRAGTELSVLDEDRAQQEVMFFHQLLQEFFAARKLAAEPQPDLVRVAWHVDHVRPTLADTLAQIADSDPLPPLAATGWEETTTLAAAMSANPDNFVRALMDVNLPLAARCAAAPDARVSETLRDKIRRALIARAQDRQADLRARIAAGLALGEIGDPRFERRTGPHGDYLLPPMILIEGGVYPIGDDNSDYDFEKPAHTVELAAFEIGQFPVTNAEYALFMAAGGYDDEQWWDTDAAQAWRRGEGSTEGSKQQWRDNKKLFESWSEDFIRKLVPERITSEQAEQWIAIRNMSEDEFERQLEEAFPAGKIYHQPGFWDDANFNNPAQPVVGVTWFEARAYCAWLTAQVSGSPRPEGEGPGVRAFCLPTETQFEAAARGKTGRLFPYGSTFDASRGNTFESHIRRTTPVGIFENATPEGVFDLSGNAYTWTTSIYDQEQFPYPYRADDGRENIRSDTRRVLRGGAWNDYPVFARAVIRLNHYPYLRLNGCGFRVVRPPSL